MKTFLAYFTGVLLVTLMACREPDVFEEGACNTFSLGEPFEAKISETWCLENGSLNMTFNTILEDSRCNVQGIECVWAGRFVMAMHLDVGGDTHQDTFYAVRNWQDTLQAGMYDIALIKVIPEIRQQFSIPDTSDYSFRVVVD